MKLSQICTLKQWKTISKNQLVNEGYPVYGANGIIGYSNEFNHETPTLMIGCRGTCGEIHLSEGKAYINGNAMCLDNLSSEFDINYVKYFLEHYDFSKIITGTAQPQITQQGLDKVQISKIPLEEQKLIASKITNIKELISIETNAIRNLDILIKSRFNEMFINSNYPIAKFQNYMHRCVDIGSNGVNALVMQHYNITNKKDYAFVVRFTNLNNNDFSKDVRFLNKADYDFFKKSKVFGGEIIFCKIGSAGINYIMPKLDVPVTLGLNQIMITPKNINTIYLYNYINSEKGIEYLSKNAKGAVTKTITKHILWNFPILVPPINVQNNFASFVELIDKLKFNCQQRIKLYQELLDKKMDEYFD